ncbi:MAG: hypothetical protein M3315_02080 [Actinomycetota bacterium]|jgi:hypothetical protein|nr:hypothetical protein [Actinomycetota bacterium]HZB82985.1 hypothetical protein [Rubrobacteraceae bacterium]
MQEPRGDEATLQGLQFAEQMVDGFTESAKVYWRMWGPLGEPMIQSIDAWAAMQHQYIQWLRETYGAQGRSS